MKYIVYTEIWNDDMTTENWYCGQCQSNHQANELALALGSGNGVYHKICTENEVYDLQIKNLPTNLRSPI